jgi:hypothetical protein
MLVRIEELRPPKPFAISRDVFYAINDNETPKHLIKDMQTELAQLREVCASYHAAWLAYKVFPSLANERLFAEAESEFDKLKK